MTEREREIAIAARLADEAMHGSMGWWYLSFADGSRPRGTQFLGGCCVQALGMATAHRAAIRLGIAPGGSVQGSPIPDGIEPPEGYRNRLLTAADIEKLDGLVQAERRARGLEAVPR